MKITVLSTDLEHPVIPYIQSWIKSENIVKHTADLIHDKKNLTYGDILFLVSCGQIISEEEREGYKATLILHASDLPKGRGWSPHIWGILNGESELTLSLLEASEPVDSGAIWLQKKIVLQGHELLPEINNLLFMAELELMTEVINSFNDIRPRVQEGDSGLFLRKRNPDDSEINPLKSIAEQFDLLRVVDNTRYPAFFEHRGKRYLIKIEKDDDFESR